MRPNALWFTIGIICLSSPAALWAGGAADVPPSKKKWTNAAELSAVAANGNTKSSTFSGKNTFHYDWRRTALDLYAGGLGATSNNVVTAEQYNAGEKVSQKISQRNYVFENADWDKNRFAGYRNRYSLSSGVGRHLMDSSKNKLLAELGAGYVNEQRILTPREKFGTARAFVKYARTLSATANFSQDAEYLQNLKDPDGYRVATNSALVASISTHMSMKFSYQWKLANRPAPGFLKSDELASATIIVNY